MTRDIGLSLLAAIAGASPTTAPTAMSTVARLFGTSNQFDKYLVPGVIVLGTLLLVTLVVTVRLLSQFLRRRRGAQLVDGLSTNIHSLQIKFAAAMDEFRRRGKHRDPIAAPWYIVAGEPGAGKTEAIRHADIDFVRGMNDMEAGIGGTLNVDWWIADDAILLDTAGRLMFEKTPDGQPGEWSEVLRLLKEARPRCPINGMILAIPCNHLFNAAEKDVRAKADKIAREFDKIQQTLGVRFPVYVVLTKADMLPGFRKFFTNLKDGESVNQMLGWTNPDNLDNNFDPGLVDQHFADLAARLRRLRLSFLMEPKIVEPKGTRRADQLDALFGFPNSLQTISKNLGTYLRTVFTTSDWLDKPLFLRGIYFTSAMQHGAELDVDLGRLLGPAEGGPAAGRQPGRVSPWQEDRTYFLRDVFLNKAFPEKGLVTNSGNVAASQRMRNGLLTGALVLAAVTLVVGTIWGYLSMKGSIGEQVKFNQAINASGDHGLALADDRQYRGSDAAAGFNNLQRIGVEQVNLELMRKGIRIPWCFRPWTNIKFGDFDVEGTSRHHHADVFRADVLEPYLTALRSAGERLPDDPAKSHDAIGTISDAVLALQGFSDYLQSKSSGPASLDVGPLARLCGGTPPPGDRASKLDVTGLAAACGDPTRVVQDIAAARQSAVYRCEEYLRGISDLVNNLCKRINTCQQHEATFVTALKRFAAGPGVASRDGDDHVTTRDEGLLQSLRLVMEKLEGVQDDMRQIERPAKMLPTNSMDTLSEAVVKLQAQIAADVDTVRKLDPSFDIPQPAQDEKLTATAEASIFGPGAELNRRDSWAADRRVRWYADLGTQLNAAPAPAAAEGSADLAGFLEQLDARRSSPEVSCPGAVGDDERSIAQAVGVASRFLVRAKGEAYDRGVLAAAADALTKPGGIRQAVRSRANGADPLKLPAMGVSVNPGEPLRDFDPAAATAVFADLGKLVRPAVVDAADAYADDAGTGPRGQVLGAAAQYADDYVTFWSRQYKSGQDQMAQASPPSPPGAWDTVKGSLGSRDQLEAFLKRFHDALGVPFLSDPEPRQLKGLKLKDESKATLLATRTAVDAAVGAGQQDPLRASILNWDNLVELDADAARQRIVALSGSPADVQLKYWVPAEQPNLAERFWQVQFAGGMNSLAAASEAELAQLGDKITTGNQAKFPFNQQADEDMTPAELDGARKQFGNTRFQLLPQERPVGIDPALYAQLQVINCGFDASRGGEERARFKTVKDELDWLHWVDLIEKARVTVLCATNAKAARTKLDPDRKGAYVYSLLQVAGAPGPVGFDVNRTLDGVQLLGDTVKLTAYDADVNGQYAEFDLGSSETPIPAWYLLRQLRDGGAISWWFAPDSADRTGIVCRLPTVTQGRLSASLYVRLDLPDPCPAFINPRQGQN